MREFVALFRRSLVVFAGKEKPNVNTIRLTHLGSVALQHHAREFQDMYVGSKNFQKFFFSTFATELVRYLDSLILVHLQKSKPSGSSSAQRQEGKM